MCGRDEIERMGGGEERGKGQTRGDMNVQQKFFIKNDGGGEREREKRQNVQTNMCNKN